MKYRPISLDEMDNVKLMNRIDSKYVFSASHLPELLSRASEFYRILEIENNREFRYRTVYFDTVDLKMYTAHQNGKLNRYKIREREYLISGIRYIEVKFKSNKGRTIKKRIKNKGAEESFNEKSIEFISKTTPFCTEELIPQLWNRFSRVTLVHKFDKERITIDMELSFRNAVNDSLNIPEICIAEIKRERSTINSDFIRLLREFKIREVRISKYCIGSVLLNKNLKYNRFKTKILILNKLAGNDTLHIAATKY